MTAASLAPSSMLPPDELSRIPDTDRPEVIEALMMSLSRLASPSASSPLRRTIVFFSRERVVVRSAADAEQHAAATHANANRPLNTAYPTRKSPVRTVTPASRRLQSFVGNFCCAVRFRRGVQSKIIWGSKSPEELSVAPGDDPQPKPGK